jgi:hypothetical protein
VAGPATLCDHPPGPAGLPDPKVPGVASSGPCVVPVPSRELHQLVQDLGLNLMALVARLESIVNFLVEARRCPIESSITRV